MFFHLLALIYFIGFAWPVILLIYVINGFFKDR